MTRDLNERITDLFTGVESLSLFDVQRGLSDLDPEIVRAAVHMLVTAKIPQWVGSRLRRVQ